MIMCSLASFETLEIESDTGSYHSAIDHDSNKEGERQIGRQVKKHFSHSISYANEYLCAIEDIMDTALRALDFLL